MCRFERALSRALRSCVLSEESCLSFMAFAGQGLEKRGPGSSNGDWKYRRHVCFVAALGKRTCTAIMVGSLGLPAGLVLYFALSIALHGFELMVKDLVPDVTCTLSH